MYNPQVHYRSFFSLERSKASNSPNIYQSVIDHVGRWLYNHRLIKNYVKDVFRPWLFQGGSLPVLNESFWVEVRTEGYDFGRRSADYWVMRFEHTDEQHRMRKWRIDISVTCYDQDTADFCITVTWFLAKNYFGETPAVPPSSVPRLVTNLFSDEMIRCMIGGKEIINSANYVSPGKGRDLYRFINSAQRLVPVILFNRSKYTDLIDPDGLQKLVLGSAVLYYYDEAEVHREVGYEWGRSNERYICRPDAIRVYLPELNTKNEYDDQRHRYFPLSQYATAPAHLLNIISQSVFRISSRNVADHMVTNFETLYIHQQKNRLLKLREAAGNAPRSNEESEYISALEEENIKLSTEAKSLNDALNQESDNATLLAMQNEELADKFEKLQDQYRQVGILEGKYKQVIGSEIDVLAAFDKLPVNLKETLQLIEKLFNNRIYVLDAAFESAEDAKFNNVAEAYKLLHAMGSILYNLYFQEQCKDIESAFKNVGYELSLNESSMTNNDHQLMALRKRNYNGKEHIFSAHTKLDKGGHHLRIHYIADHSKKMIVIGHCGDHLKTAGTTRRKEG